MTLLDVQQHRRLAGSYMSTCITLQQLSIYSKACCIRFAGHQNKSTFMFTNLGGGGSRGGFNLLGWIYLLVAVFGPYLLVWLEVRAIRKAEAQSLFALVVLVLLGSVACYYNFDAARELSSSSGLTGFHLLIVLLGAMAFLPALGWELYKRGWLKFPGGKM
jgi:hypothetical protein